jgi:prepilin-type N-terminal cleavage/methylation domain-containing protein
MEKRRRRGFTLIELLVFSAIFALIIGAFITILITVVTTQTQQSASAEAQQQGQFLLQQFQYYIESARLVDMTQDVATSTLVLRESISSSSYDPTIFTLTNGTVYLQQGAGGTPQPLTSNKVTISSLSFTRHYNVNSTSSPLGTDSVSYSFIVSSSAGNQANYSESFQSSASVFASVPKIALIQQTKSENNTSVAVSSIGKAFPTNNESGDLLLAVVANQTVVTSTVADTNGNTWVKIANVIFSPDILTLYAATNASSGPDTVTATFGGGGATYPSLYLYEYRGASTSTSLDANSAQGQSSTSTPTSPFVSPLSTVELLFGIDDNAYPTNAVATPGAGYTLETSSTVNNSTQVFVEDQNQYISSPVAASWQFNMLTTSTAMIATFR